MILSNLTITRAQWGKNEGRLEGEITFKNPSGEVKLILPEDVAQRLLAIVADGVVESSKAIANDLTAAVLTAVPALEHQE